MSFGQDVRFGLRVLRTSPGLTVVAVVTLALGIAANTTVFSWIDKVLVHPFPGCSRSDRLAVLEMVTNAPNGGTQLSYVEYRDFQRSLTTIAGLVMHREEVFGFGEDQRSQPVWGELVNGDYFGVLGVTPQIGRVFTKEEDGDNLGAFPVAVISDSLWRSRFHADPAICGKTIRVNQRDLTVVGVAPPEFHGTQPALSFHIWIPATMGVQLGLVSPDMFKLRSHRNMYAIVRLKPGVTIGRAHDEVSSIAHQLAVAFPQTNQSVGATVLPVWRFHGGAPDLLLEPLRILMAVAILVLLIVCVNVSNLLLARSVMRQREFGIRLALGSGRLKLVRQLLIETLLLALAGALLGLVVSAWMADSLRLMTPSVGVSVSTGFRVNGEVLAFAMICCVAAALASGVAPALFSSRADVNKTLKEGARGGTAGSRSHRFNGLLVVSEVALAVVALIGAGLFARSFYNARSIYPGFDKSNVLLGRFFLGGPGHTDRNTKAFCVNVRNRMLSAPGVLAGSYADFAPLGSSAGPWDDVEVEGYVPAPGETMTVSRAMIGPGYFETLGIPLLEGRDFTDNEDSKKPEVVIVNQTFARRYFHGTHPLGRRIKCNRAWATVIGLVKDSKYFNVSERPQPYVYASFQRRYAVESQLYFFLKTRSDPIQAAASLRNAVFEADPGIGTFYPMPLSVWTEVTMLPQRMAASLIGALGAISLFLAAIGLYSVMAYAVTQRTQEIGVRMALGALPSDVFGDVLRRGMALTGAGLTIGLILSVVMTRLIGSMLVNISAVDPLTFVAAALFLAGVGLLANFIPARRATRVDPIVALRCE